MDYGGGQRDWFVSRVLAMVLLLTSTACTFGASIICVDLIIRLFPGKKNFKIEDSNVFLSTGLSLSFGVMVRVSPLLKL